jgi:glutathione S-transferase
MKLYDCKGAVNPRRVDIFLAEKGIEIDRVQVNVFGGEHRSDKSRKLNPSCAVPFLELDDGVVISESTAISRYIEGQQPQPPLMGKTPQEQAYISMWQRRVEDGLLYAAQHYFHHATPGLGEPDRYRNADWGEANKQRAIETMRWLDKELATRPFIAGEAFTIVDITALCGIDFAHSLGVSMPSDCGALNEWHARVSARSSAKA